MHEISDLSCLVHSQANTDDVTAENCFLFNCSLAPGVQNTASEQGYVLKTILWQF